MAIFPAEKADAQQVAVRAAEVEIDSVAGVLSEGQLILEIDLEVTTYALGQWVDLASGDAVVLSLVDGAGRVVVGNTEAAEEGAGLTLGYDLDAKTYRLTFAAVGSRQLTMRIAVRASLDGVTGWYEAVLGLPITDRRTIRIVSPETDLAIELPGTVRFEQSIEGEDDAVQQVVTGVQGLSDDLRVRWKPTVRTLDARLVMTTQSNTIVTVNDGSLRVDFLLEVQVAQGQMQSLKLLIPNGLEITQVHGAGIQDWSIVASDNEGDDEAELKQVLRVTLSLPVSGRYALQVLGEQALEVFPTSVDVPVIQPPAGIRSSGHVAIGTDHAIGLVVEDAAGLTQIDHASMPRVALRNLSARTLPGQLQSTSAGISGKVFFYSHVTSPYRASLKLDHIVPAFDANYRVVVAVREDAVVLEGAIELDIRDAPIREVDIAIPPGFSVVGVSGAMVKEDQFQRDHAEGPMLHVSLTQPVRGNLVLGLKLESVDPPVEGEIEVHSFTVRGAQNQRGFVVVSVEPGLAVEVDSGESLGQVNTASTPFSTPGAQVAYRMRDAAWSLALTTKRKPATLRAEVFQLVSLGEGIVYGNAAINYYITGSPVESLNVRIDPRLTQIEFLSRDVRRARRDDDDPSLWHVELQRPIPPGDYNLGIVYSQRYTGEKGQVIIGGIASADAETQTTYIAVTSALDLDLTDPVGAGKSPITAIQAVELPANYRLLVTAPLLRTYKSVGAAPATELAVSVYERAGMTPVLLELVQSHTQLAPATSSGSQAESVTQVLYRIKNVRSQYMRLQMPAGATGIAVHRVVPGTNQRQRIAVSFDPKTAVLMIPLDRPLDPNEPMALELTYGQVHAASPDGKIVFNAPMANVTATYETWTLEAPKGWVLDADQASGQSAMVPDRRVAHRGTLGLVLDKVGRAWRMAISDAAMDGGRLWFVLLIVFAIALLGMIFTKTYGPAIACGAVLAIGVWLGVSAAQMPGIDHELRQPDALQAMTWTRIINQETDVAPQITLRAVPVDSYYLSNRTAFFGLALAVGSLVAGALYRRLRWLLWAAGTGVSLYIAGRVPGWSLPLAHALTWGVPLALLAWVGAVAIKRGLAGRGRAVAASAVAAALGLCVLGISGCNTPEVVVSPRMDVLMDRVECELTAEYDTMAVELSLSFHAKRPMRFYLAGDGAVLLDSAQLPTGLKIIREGGDYLVEVKEKGHYALDVSLLVPLAPADANQLHTFAFPLPPALTNRVKINLPQVGLDVFIPTAITHRTTEGDGVTTVEATLGPDDALGIIWRPRTRRRDLETTEFTGQVKTLVSVGPGAAQAVHEITLDIAQGQVDEIVVQMPPGMTVTDVSGAYIGTWRFDPESGTLETRLTAAATTSYRLLVLTQVPVEPLPYALSVSAPRVVGAIRQRTTLGLMADPVVYATVDNAPPAMNGQDFARDAAILLGGEQRIAQAGEEIRFACSLSEDDSVQVTVREVLPEVRSFENASFIIEEERLVYASDFSVTIDKAGVFSFQLRLPAEYEIESLEVTGASHWDEEVNADGEHRVTVHFSQRVTGTIPLHLRISRSIDAIPDVIAVPRIEAADAIKHAGQLTIAATQGIRIEMAQRDGVSELDPREIGIRTPGVLAAQMLRPNWTIALGVEQIQPRVTAEVLHLATLSDGVIRQTAYLRYQLQHAGSKIFRFELPQDAVGVRIVGAQIARRTPVADQPGVWEVELSAKWFDRPYLLAVQFDTRYDPAEATAHIAPVRTLGTQRQRGYLTVMAGGRVEVSVQAKGAEMVRCDARSVPPQFGAGDLSQAALCFRCPSDAYAVSLDVHQLASAQLAQASVLTMQVTSVLTPRGDSIGRARLSLRVGGRRHLAMRLPDGGTLLSAHVSGQSVTPSIRPDAKTGEAVYLLPLNTPRGEDLDVIVDVVYAVDRQGAKAGVFNVESVRFDLPLRDIEWEVYVPEGYDYSDFSGNVAITQQDFEDFQAIYTPEEYDQTNLLDKSNRINTAVQLQAAASHFADLGDNDLARAALEQAMYFSQGDRVLNEDARIELHRLTTDQAVVGLIGSRQRLREMASGAMPMAAPSQDPAILRLTRADLRQVRANLSGPDNENLALIASRFMAAQAPSAQAAPGLRIQLPKRGEVLYFTRPVQAQADAALTVGFHASATSNTTGGGRDYSPWVIGILLALVLLGWQWAANRRLSTEVKA